jgi:hypothetical protein
MGRPPKDPAFVRNLHLDVDLSPSELQALRELASRLHLPLRTFVRETALGARLPRAVPAVNLELARDLARVGGNLNQLLHAVHIGKVKEPPAVDLLELQFLLAQVRRLLRGEGS